MDPSMIIMEPSTRRGMIPCRCRGSVFLECQYILRPSQEEVLRLPVKLRMETCEPPKYSRHGQQKASRDRRTPHWPNSWGVHAGDLPRTIPGHHLGENSFFLFGLQARILTHWWI